MANFEKVNITVMEKRDITSNEVDAESHPKQEFIKEWKQKKAEDEREFLEEINQPEHRKKIESVRGKIISNGTASA